MVRTMEGIKAAEASAEGRDRAGELLTLLDRAGFGTVVITVPGDRFVCGLDDVREAIRRRVTGDGDLGTRYEITPEGEKALDAGGSR